MKKLKDRILHLTNRHIEVEGEIPYLCEELCLERKRVFTDYKGERKLVSPKGTKPHFKLERGDYVVTLDKEYRYNLTVEQVISEPYKYNQKYYMLLKKEAEVYEKEGVPSKFQEVVKMMEEYKVNTPHIEVLWGRSPNGEISPFRNF